MKAGEEELLAPPRALSFDRLKVVSALGRGAKGVVFLVEHDSELLALKVISKDLIEKRNKKKNRTPENNPSSVGVGVGDGDEYRRVCFEQSVLGQFRHPLLPRLRGVLADSDRLVGYAIDYCPGRDLNSLRKNQTERMFSDDVIRFYGAELVLALEYLHGLGIVYRDLKPENVMVQENGHIMIVDFDLSTKLSFKSPARSASASGSEWPVPAPESDRRRRFPPSPFRWCRNSGVSPAAEGDDSGRRTESESEKSNSFVGTEEYVAPEIVSGEGHDFAVDWWSLGVVMYEMLYGATPFRGANRKETFYRILTRRPELVGEPTALRDLIGKLLEKDPRVRIGVDQIKGHDFFRGIDWDSVVQISRPPYIPDVGGLDEGKDGIKNIIDVETVVQGIFGDGEKVVVDDDDDDDDHTGNVNITTTKAWLEGLNSNNHPTHTDKFLVF